MKNKTIMLCAICNISSGNCSEDCGFCAQSNKHDLNIEKFYKKDLKKIIQEARIAKKNKALGFCLVTSGKGLNNSSLDFVCQASFKIKKEVGDLMLIGCNGIASKEQLKELKKAGIQSYNHNLETSKEFYNQICTSHSWEERYQTNIYAREVGLMLCCGGIYGIGETQEDRISLLESLKSLKPFSSPINFFISNPSLSIQKNKLSQNQALEIISFVKSFLPLTKIMIAGGREAILKEKQYEVFKAGADAIVIGDYLTAPGEKVSKDLDNLKKLGYNFATYCH